MKNKLIILLFTFTPFLANAQDAKVFVGKYVPVNCPSQINATSAYISLQKYAKSKQITVDFYGDEEPGIQYYNLTPGKFQLDGTEEEIHGKITRENFIQWPSSTHMVIHSQIIDKGRVEPTYLLADFNLIGNKLVLSADDEKKCILKKVN